MNIMVNSLLYAILPILVSKCNTLTEIIIIITIIIIIMIKVEGGKTERIFPLSLSLFNLDLILNSFHTT